MNVIKSMKNGKNNSFKKSENNKFNKTQNKNNEALNYGLQIL